MPSTRRTKPPAKGRAKTKTKPKSVIDRIVPMDVSQEGMKVLLYGRSGTGKTTFWSTFPKPILAVICSGGNKPGELRSIDTPENRKSIDMVHLESTMDFEEILAYQLDTEKYKTVVLDHASGFQDKILAELLEVNEIPAQKSWGLASREEYGQMTMQFKEHLRRFYGLACNAVVIAQEREFNADEESKAIMPHVGSALTPSLTGWMNNAADYVCQTFIRRKTETKKRKIGSKVKTTTVETDEAEYCLRIGPDPVYMTKFRAPKGSTKPDIVVDPDYSKLNKYVTGG